MARDYTLHPLRAPLKLQVDYEGELNAQQLAAVRAAPGPALVIAGAGAGKTRTLTYRVAYLLEHGVPPEHILLLTFTNKAAHEMMRRVAELLGSDLAALWGGTFHAIGLRVLRRHADLLGYRPDFTILDREDAGDLLKACIDEANIDVGATRFPKAEVVADLLSLSLNTDQPLATVLQRDYPQFESLRETLEALQRSYAQRKQRSGVMDFDDLLVLWRRLLLDEAAVREQYQERFHFVLVDEYQDTNRLQGELIDLLGARHRNVMAVGDDAQSIYSWRGADFRNILEFPKRYPEARVYKIETNYRSTPEILNFANAAIAANVHQFAKNLVPARKPGVKPGLVACATGEAQAIFVAQRVLELRDEGTALGQMAVLYRSHFHTLELQLELTRRNIPFTLTSGIRFFEQAHIKDVAAFLRLTVNPADELAFKRLARLLRGIGGKTADRLWSTFAAACRPPEVALGAALQHCAAFVPRKAAVDWAQFTATMAQLDQPELRRQPGPAVSLVLEAGYEDTVRAQYTNARSRLEDLGQLALFARQFESIEDFLAQLALLTNLEADDHRPARADEEGLRLSTIHQAKGLEFDVVFVIMLSEGLFPSRRSIETDPSVEEERRLFYVAVTRARNELYLAYPLVRSNPGQGMDWMQQPSRFLGEVPADLREEWNLQGFVP